MRTELFDENDVIENSSQLNYNGKILVLSPNTLSEEYQQAKYQLVKASGGFGCDPHKIGRAVFVEFITDGVQLRCNRGDFIGILKEEIIKELGIQS